uniref:Uncharacterized protein n=1 Tax=Anguilla anguilla TaxID=7936 RepID=A0A0E9SC77_ANGAN
MFCVQLRQCMHLHRLTVWIYRLSGVRPLKHLPLQQRCISVQTIKYEIILYSVLLGTLNIHGDII